MVKVSRFGSGGVGSRSREDCLQEAAAIYLQLGNLQRYCEILVGLGEVSLLASLYCDGFLKQM